MQECAGMYTGKKRALSCLWALRQKAGNARITLFFRIGWTRSLIGLIRSCTWTSCSNTRRDCFWDFHFGCMPSSLGCIEWNQKSWKSFQHKIDLFEIYNNAFAFYCSFFCFLFFVFCLLFLSVHFVTVYHVTMARDCDV